MTPGRTAYAVVEECLPRRYAVTRTIFATPDPHLQRKRKVRTHNIGDEVTSGRRNELRGP